MKKCPYCAEQIQDEAIVCRYCGRDLIAKVVPVDIAQPTNVLPVKKVKKKPTIQFILSFIIISIILVCIIFLVIRNSLSNTSQNKAVQLVQTTMPVETAMPLSTSTPRPMFGMSLSDFQMIWESQTDIQRKAFITDSIGKWVYWSGTINGVESDGRIVVNIPGELFGAVDVKGIPQNVLMNLSKDQTIHFTGQITGIVTMVGPFITIENAQLVP